MDRSAIDLIITLAEGLAFLLCLLAAIVVVVVVREDNNQSQPLEGVPANCDRLDLSAGIGFNNNQN